MTGFRASHLAAQVLLVAGFALAAAAAAAQTGQSGGPIRIAPLGGAAPPTAGPAPRPPAGAVQVEPLRPSVASPQSAPPQSPSPQSAPTQSVLPPAGIQAEPLRAADQDGAGIVAGPGDAPFGEGQWDGTPRSLALQLLQRLPSALPSPVLRDLQVRLLSTAARPPAGTAAADGSRLLPLRLEKLVAIGDAAGLDRLLAQLPSRGDDEGVAQIRLDRLLLAARYDEACAEVKRQIERYRGAYWQQAQIVCQVVAGQASAAALGAQLLREQGFDDPTFYGLVELLSGTRGARIDPPPALSALHLVLMRHAKRDPSPAMLAAAAPAVARTIAQGGDYAQPLRLAAAERAAAVGAVDGEALAQIYLATEPQGNELQNPIGAAKADTGPRGRALLYRAARNQANPGARAEIVVAALEAARSPAAGGAAGYFAAARLYRPLIEAIEPSPELGSFALDAARALFAAGATAKARAWVDFARRRGAADPQAAAAAVRLWPVDWLAAGDAGGRPASGPILAWAEADRRRQPVGADERLALLVGLIEATGELVPAQVWGATVGAPRAAGVSLPPAAIAHLRSAAGAPRPAEAIALLLGLAGDREASAAGALLAPEIVLTLRGLGLEEAAQRFAVETALTGL